MRRCALSRFRIRGRGPMYRDWPTLYKRADAALYQAKEGGRNRVVQAAPPQPALV